MFQTLKSNLQWSKNKHHCSNNSSLPLYSPLAASDSAPRHDADSDAESSSSRPNQSTVRNDNNENQLKPAQRHAPSACSTVFVLPSLNRFLADFTLGFADGLTVPFALTAGLSSLGQTNTVIYAGMAELCAGSISMGIGGYLSAKGEKAIAAARETRLPCNREDHEEGTDAVCEKRGAIEGTVLDKYLAPLDLPQELFELVMVHVSKRPEIFEQLAGQEAAEDDEEEDDTRLSSPVNVGLSVALGYLIGGILPLFPYLLVKQVGDGLKWSFVVCVIALFAFGFTKHFILNRERESRDAEKMWSRLGSGRIQWRDIKRSVWEGIQMVVLGSVAALAAVLCVRLFESMGESQP